MELQFNSYFEWAEYFYSSSFLESKNLVQILSNISSLDKFNPDCFPALANPDFTKQIQPGKNNYRLKFERIQQILWYLDLNWALYTGISNWFSCTWRNRHKYSNTRVQWVDKKSPRARKLKSGYPRDFPSKRVTLENDECQFLITSQHLHEIKARHSSTG